jgi:hypothetical protein
MFIILDIAQFKKKWFFPVASSILTKLAHVPQRLVKMCAPSSTI